MSALTDYFYSNNRLLDLLIRLKQTRRDFPALFFIQKACFPVVYYAVMECVQKNLILKLIPPRQNNNHDLIKRHPIRLNLQSAHNKSRKPKT